MAGDQIDPYDLNQSFAVWRTTTTDDGQGGQDTEQAQAGTVRGKASEPTAAERTEAMRSGVDLTHTVHLLPDADVRRGDELRAAGEVFRVQSTVHPSVRAYLKAMCTSDQVEE